MIKATAEQQDSAREPPFDKEQAYIHQQLGGADESDSAVSGPDGLSSCDELDEEYDKHLTTWRRPGFSSDGGYASSSDEDKCEETPIKSVNCVIDLSENSCPSQNEAAEETDHPFDIQQLLQGKNVGIPDDIKVPIDIKPDWLDMKKLTIGQKFARENYFGLNYAEMISLLFLFSIPDGLEPLIYTGKSGTPFTAFRRYLSTVLRVKSWFEHDIWNEGSLGYKNLKTVRAMHLNVSKHLNSTPYNELKDQMTVRGPTKENAVWAPLKDTISEDFQSGCPFHEIQRSDDDNRYGKVFFNQFSMSITQFGFVGLMVTYPEKFGAANATDEELEGFIHLWRGLGYLLGIEDRFNFCNGSLQEVRQRCDYIIHKIVKPRFLLVTEDWEHMSRCLVEGISYYTPSLSFEVSLLYLCWVLGILTPRTTATLSWWQSFKFQLTKVTLCFTLRLPGMRSFHNWLVRRSIMKASSWSDERLRELESKSYDYENGTSSTKL